MPECHKCETNAQIERANRLVDATVRDRDRLLVSIRPVCATCPGAKEAINAASTARAGKSVVSLDAVIETHHEADHEHAHEQPAVFSASDAVAIDRSEERMRDAYLRHIAYLSMLPPRHLAVICTQMRRPEWTKAMIARHFKMPLQRVHEILGRHATAANIRLRRNKKRLEM